MAGASFIIGIDVGGTFTDVALVDSAGTVHMSKAPTTPVDPSRGVFDALRRAAHELGMDLGGLLSQTVRITHGSTVATNALLTRSGAKVGLITTRGVEDTPFIMRAIGRVDGLSEAEIRHVAWLTKPTPLVSRSLVRGVTERIDVQGAVVVPLQTEDVVRGVAELVEEHRVEGLGVCLLNSWANPAHERRIQEIIEDRYHGNRVYCAYSHRLARVAGEYARMNTVLVDCFVGPRVHTYLARLEEELRRQGFGEHFLIMQGSGGLTGREQCAPVATLQSGPAGGMLAAAYMAGVLGHTRVLTADMGGTSFDGGIYADGHWRYAEEPVFDRFRILQPTIEIESIGAGGGTLARVDAETGRLLVGPQSAGADPGPACYGLGGAEPTVTDANVVLGIIDPAYFLGGVISLDSGRARAAIEDCVARPLRMDVRDAATGIQEIINGKMADLIRRRVVRSGYLPEEFVLYAFGGAAGTHAGGFARDLGIRTIYVFPTSPVFSAFGIAVADMLHTRVMTCQFELPTAPERLNEPIEALEGDLDATMVREGFRTDEVIWRRYASLRFRRQAVGVELELPWARLTEGRMLELIELFARRYEDLYGGGAGSVEAGVEVGALRVDAVGPVPKPVPKPVMGRRPRTGSAEPSPKSRRSIYIGGQLRETAVFEWADLEPGQRITGPGIVESQFTTVLVPPESRGELDERGNLVLNLA